MDYIDRIIASNDNAKMEALKSLYKETLDYIKATDLQKYREIECSLYEIIEGKRLNEEKAHKWVSSMKPLAKWSMEDVKGLKTDIPLVDFYVLMNMMYTDYHDVLGEDVESYVKMSEDWYNDSDAEKKGSEKLYCYGKVIVGYYKD